MDNKDFRITGIQPSPEGPKVEIQPLENFDLGKFLKNKNTLSVTRFEPEIGSESDEDDAPVYTLEVPDWFVRKCWGDEYSLQDFDEYPLKISFNSGPDRQITGNDEEFELLDCNRCEAVDIRNCQEPIKAIDYRNSDYYCFEMLGCLLVISELGNKSPDLEGYSLYQVIGIGNENFGEVQEFISFGSFPDVFYWDTEALGINFIIIEGEKNAGTGLWDLRLNGYWFSFEDNEEANLSLLEMNEMEVTIVGYVNPARQKNENGS